MTGVSMFRLHVPRAGYLLLVVGLGSTIWPAILDHTTTWELKRGVVVSMLGASIVGPPDELGNALLMGAGWVMNLTVAEWAIRRWPAPPAETNRKRLIPRPSASFSGGNA